MAELKPCPFCGVKPRLYWESWKEISPESGIYVLEANHTNNCYIYRINGMNSTGRASSRSKVCLVEWWNRRVKDE